MKKFLAFLLVQWLFFSSLFCHVTYKDQKVVVQKVVEGKNALISYVLINNHPYIIKQKRNKIKVVICVMREALAAHIARDFNIAHIVDIIPMKDNIPGKQHKNLPATLHSIAPGVMVRHHDSKYAELCIKQRCPKVTERWFDEIIVDQITWHKQLPIIVALDLFLCNTDRHKGNLFYDEKADSFCAIDMDNIYRRNLPFYAGQNIANMIKDKKKFTSKEIEALKVVKQTLEFLLQKYPYDKLIALLRTFAEQGGYRNDGSPENENVKKRMQTYENMMKESQLSADKLVKILDKVINN
jgi:hypothetical protein